MPDAPRDSFLGRTLQNLRRLWRDAQPAGWRRGERPLAPDLPDADRERLRGRIDACLSARGGEVSARRRAAELGTDYLALSPAGRERFLRLLAVDYGVDRRALDEAVGTLQTAAGPDRLLAEERLRDALVTPRLRLLTQFNALPAGTKFLVDLRADLLGVAGDDPALRSLDRELQRLLASWFDPGFLELRRIDWQSPAALLEKLMAYEAVHEIESWDDLRNRLETDRCCYAFFHHHMPGEPLIFVEVALVEGMADDVQALLDEDAPAVPTEAADTAIFYSISNTQRGLRGISFGGFLIKAVVDDLRARFPRLRQFATLSPLPGFCRWLEGLERSRLDALLGAETAASLLEDAGAAGGSPQALATALRAGAWVEDAARAQRLREPLLRLGAQYLVREKRGRGPLDPVARFHLGNGARVERLNWLGNRSPAGLERAAGLMVNYAYRLGEMEQNHERFEGEGEVAVGPDLRRLHKR